MKQSSEYRYQLQCRVCPARVGAWTFLGADVYVHVHQSANPGHVVEIQGVGDDADDAVVVVRHHSYEPGTRSFRAVGRPDPARCASCGDPS